MDPPKVNLGLIFGFVAVFLLSLFSIPTRGEVRAEIPNIEFNVKETVMDNGLTVLLLEDHSAPIISYNTFFKVGSRCESPGITGITHVIEHLMFQAAKGPLGFDKIIEAQGGYSNAYVYRDFNWYFADFPSDVLETFMELESDRMRNITFDAGSFENEMEVIKQERRVNWESDIRGQMEMELFALAFSAHPYRWSPIGWKSDLSSIEFEDCVKYFKEHYVPRNAVIVLVGDFEAEKAIELLRKYYGDIPPGGPLRPVRTVEPEQLGEKRMVIRRAAELPALGIGYKVPGACSESDDVFILDMIDVILAEGQSSRLYKSLVRDLGIALDISIGSLWRRDDNLLHFFIKMKPGHTAEKCEGAFYAVLDSLAEYGVGDREMLKAQNILTGRSLRTLQTVREKARKIGFFTIVFGDYRNLLRSYEVFQSATSEDIQRIVRTYFTAENRSVVTLVPECDEE